MFKFNKKVVRSYMYVFVAAALYTIGTQAFLQVAHIFSSGLGAMAALPTFIVDKHSINLLPYFSVFYLAINIPLITYYWNKNSKKFTYRTLFFLITQALLGTIFLIPDAHTWLGHLINTSKDKNLSVRQQEWPIFIYAIAASVFVGSSIAIAWKFGGSSGGSDIITYYWTTKRKMDVGLGMMLMAVFFLTSSFVITIIFNENMREYWFITLLASFLYIIMISRIVNIIYPKYKKVSLHIVSSETGKICKYLKDSNYIHSWKIHEFKSGYTNDDKEEITTTIFLLELKELSANLKKIDQNIWIQVTPVNVVIGSMNSDTVDYIH